MAALRVTLFGGFEARLGGGSTAILSRKKAQGLLAYLALHPGQAHPRDKLAALLWGDSTDERARHSLRQTLLALKQSLPHHQKSQELLVIRADTVALNGEAVDVDVAAFERLVAEGTLEAVAQASALYRGDFLEGLGVQEARFEEWLVTERERLRELALEALAKLLAHQTKTGTDEQAVQTALRLLGLDPLQESVHRTLMRLHARQGRRGVALRQYQVCVAVLQRELGLEPDAKTKQLYQEILQAAPIASPTTAPPGVDAASPRRGRIELHSDAVAPDTPLVGREAEVARLRATREAAWHGRGSIAVILGDAGIGKSRLVEELVADALEQGGRVLLGRAHESEQILPFGPWVDALRAGQVLPAVAEQSDLSATLRAELARLFPELGPPGRELADGEDYVRLFEALAQVVRCLATQQPLLLILEDLHWADEMSLRLLAFLSRRVSAWPVLLVATTRTEELVDAPALRRFLREIGGEQISLLLTLVPLSHPETATLVRRLARVGTDASAVRRLGEQIWHLSEGNPFIVVEAVWGLRDPEAFETPEELPLPPRARDVIAARLERLSNRGRQLAAVASVIGRAFDFALLLRATDLSTSEAAEGVEDLVARHILHVVGERLDFTHDRIREVTYRQLVPPRRKLLHAAVASALEALHGDQLEIHHLALGLHCWEGEVWDKAFAYLEKAGAAAASRLAHREAVKCFEQALDAFRHLPPTREQSQQAIDLRFALRNSYVALGEHGPILDHLRAAEVTAGALGDQLRLGWAFAYRTSGHLLIGESDQSIESGQRSLAIADALGDVHLQIAANLFLGQAYHWIGQYSRGADLLRRNVASLERDLIRRGDTPGRQVYSRAGLVCCLAELGEFAEGIARGEEAVRMAEAADRTYALAHACFAVGVVYLRKGDLDQAIPVLERGLNLCRGREFPVLAASVGSILGNAYALSGRLTEAVPLLEAAVGSLSDRMRGAAPFIVFLGEAYLLCGRTDDASALANRALALASQRKERGWQAWTLRLLGEIALCDERVDTASAEASYRHALALGDELGMRPLHALCQLGLGALYRRAERASHARAELSAAADLFRSLEMTFWLPRVEAELRAFS